MFVANLGRKQRRHISFFVYTTVYNSLIYRNFNFSLRVKPHPPLISEMQFSINSITLNLGFPGDSAVKNLPAMQEMQG